MVITSDPKRHHQSQRNCDDDVDDPAVYYISKVIAFFYCYLAFSTSIHHLVLDAEHSIVLLLCIFIVNKFLLGVLRFSCLSNYHTTYNHAVSGGGLFCSSRRFFSLSHLMRSIFLDIFHPVGLWTVVFYAPSYRLSFKSNVCSLSLFSPLYMK